MITTPKARSKPARDVADGVRVARLRALPDPARGGRRAHRQHLHGDRLRAGRGGWRDRVRRTGRSLQRHRRSVGGEPAREPRQLRGAGGHELRDGNGARRTALRHGATDHGGAAHGGGLQGGHRTGRRSDRRPPARDRSVVAAGAQPRHPIRGRALVGDREARATRRGLLAAGRGGGRRGRRPRRVRARRCCPTAPRPPPPRHRPPSRASSRRATRSPGSRISTAVHTGCR